MALMAEPPLEEIAIAAIVVDHQDAAGLLPLLLQGVQRPDRAHQTGGD
jgi:hypothetical protein